eukprot:14491_1
MAPTTTTLCFFICILVLITDVSSLNNGLARTPPLGWRSWNCYWFDINQTIIKDVMTALVDKSRKVNGIPTSLAEIGYNNAGIDDGWQHCNAYEKLFHNNSAPNGWPVVNTTVFPDLSGLIKYAHNNNLTVNWYFNNCKCSEHNAYPANEANDVKWMRLMGISGVKLDGCGSSMNTSNWNRLINETSNKPILTEDGGNIMPPNNANEDECPMNMFNFAMGNGIDHENNNYKFGYAPNPCYPCLMSVIYQALPYLKYPNGHISRPGCWAFPGDLQVGNFLPQYGATNTDEDRTHFSIMSIISAPLVLGFDLTNQAILNRTWDIITNYEVLNVSQQWVGHPGYLAAYASWNITYKSQILHAYDIWAKPQPSNTWAVLLVNNDGNHEQNVTVTFSDIPWSGSTKIRDIINHKDLGTFTDTYTAYNISKFGSVFLLFSH